MGAVFTAAALTGTAFVDRVFLGRVDEYATLRIALPVALVVVAVVLLLVTFTRRNFARTALRISLMVGLGVALIAPGLWVLWGVRHSENAPYASAGPPLKGTQRGGSLTSLGGFTTSSGLPASELKWLDGQRKKERSIIAVHRRTSELKVPSPTATP